ncbi:MAG: U3 snoRNP protein [Piccolia ochrophora]|nr:MAG: U3 snoRNP protein [Piccolia ochrophora]
MAAASDRARFYLEQSVPELQELYRKKIFTKTEISSIARKRSDFEHKLSAPGSKPFDYARYAEFEINLDTLRRKRTKRLSVKSTPQSGQRRVFFVFDRATRKFPGDTALWLQYIEYARKQKAYKKGTQLLTNVLRLHPTKAALWIFAAQHSLESDADMNAARSYMQRGLRFCKTSRPLWLEYAKLETIYIAKLFGRRQILGLDQSRSAEQHTETIEGSDDHITLPKLTIEDVDPNSRTGESSDTATLDKLESTPALNGAIPLAIYDAAMEQFQNDVDLGKGFFEVFAAFRGLPCLPQMLQHIVDHLFAVAPLSPSALSCYIRQPIEGVDLLSADFPRALGPSLERLDSALEKATRPMVLTEWAIDWLLDLHGTDNLDEAIKQVLALTLQSCGQKHQEASKREEAIDEVHCRRVNEEA